MFNTVFKLATLSVAAAAPLALRAAPSGWASGYLEDYETYHLRYIAINCQNQHDTTFFDDCCHPMLSTETLAANRLSYCAPNATEVSSASAIEATSTETEDLETYCESTSSAASEPTSTYIASSSTPTESTSTYVADVESSSTYEAASSSETSAVASLDVAAQFGNAKASTTSTSTSTWVPTFTSTWSEAAATTSAASSSGSGETMTGGYATYFYQGGNAGACGTVHSDSDLIIAIDSNGWWQDYSQASSYCGKYITLTNTNNGKSVTAMVADVCPTCVSNNSLDLSVGAFTAIASESDGQVPITWDWA